MANRKLLNIELGRVTAREYRELPEYDHNWVLDRKTASELELAASVYEPASGRYMEVWTDQPALQFYGGNFFDGKLYGKWGKTLNYRESIALETQKYPDTPHHAHFPSTLLNPGEKCMCVQIQHEIICHPAPSFLT